jgi:hypothetical protein
MFGNKYDGFKISLWFFYFLFELFTFLLIIFNLSYFFILFIFFIYDIYNNTFGSITVSFVHSHTSSKDQNHVYCYFETTRRSLANLSIKKIFKSIPIFSSYFPVSESRFLEFISHSIACYKLFNLWNWSTRFDLELWNQAKWKLIINNYLEVHF